MRIAYISYASEQNEPSTPLLGEVQPGQIKEDLFKLWMESFHDEDEEDPFEGELYLEKGSYGDVCVFRSEDVIMPGVDKPSSSDDCFVFVTFENSEEALKELGL